MITERESKMQKLKIHWNREKQKQQILIDDAEGLIKYKINENKNIELTKN